MALLKLSLASAGETIDYYSKIMYFSRMPFEFGV